LSKLEKWYRLGEEAREIRRRSADWGFIETLPPKLRAALKYYIETGDIRTSVTRLLRKANIPVVV
jgi:hypothetical protein